MTARGNSVPQFHESHAEPHCDSARPIVYFVDDDPAVRSALAAMATAIGVDAETFESAEEFLESLDDSRPGCVVVDLSLPGMSGLGLQARLQSMQIDLPLLMISGRGDIASAVSAIKAGAFDFLQKPVHHKVLAGQIDSALQHDRRRRVEKRLKMLDMARFARLTDRERDVLQAMVEGFTGKQTAAALGISYRTMEKHRARVMRKMEAKTLADVTRAAVRLGVVSNLP